MGGESSEMVSLYQPSNSAISEENDTAIFDIQIMVVDDDVTTLSVVGSMLRDFHYRVTTFENPIEALNTLRNKRGLIDLVVTDLHMPQMNGFQLQKHVKEEFQLPVIMMSVDNRSSVVAKSLECGSAFFISKPVCPDDVKNLWQYVIAAKRGKSKALPLELHGGGSTPIEKVNSVAIEDVIDTNPFLERESSSQGENEKISSNDNDQIETNNNNALSSGSEDKYSRKKCKRKAHEMTKDKEYNYEGTSMAPKKAKIVWTTALHNRFLLAITHLGLERAVPKKILEFMNVPGLTRENVASHLQKYRIFLRRVAEKGAIEGLSLRALRSSFASGLSSSVIKNLQKKVTLLSEQQHVRRSSILSLGSRGNTIARANSSPLNANYNQRYSNINNFRNRWGSLNRTQPATPQVPYLQSYNGVSLDHIQSYQSPGAGFGQSNYNWAGRQATAFEKPVMGIDYGQAQPQPLYQPNGHDQYNVGIGSSSSGNVGSYVFNMNATNSPFSGQSTMQMYQQRTQPSNYNHLPTFRQSNLGSIPENGGMSTITQASMDSFGVPLVGANNNNVNGYGLINGTDQDVIQIGNGSFGDMFNQSVAGSSSSSSFLQNGNKYFSAFTQVQENISQLSLSEQQSLSLQQCGGLNNVNGGSGEEQYQPQAFPNFTSTPNLSATNFTFTSTTSNFTSDVDKLVEDDFADLFLADDINEVPFEKQFVDSYPNPDSSVVSNPTEEQNPSSGTGELADFGFSNSCYIQQLLDQVDHADGMEPANIIGSNNMDLPIDESQPSFDQNPNQHQGIQEFLGSDPFGNIGNSSGSNSYMEQDWDMGLLEALFAAPPNLSDFTD